MNDDRGLDDRAGEDAWLDERIRALVASAVADAPAPGALPRPATTAEQVGAPRSPLRRRTVVAIGLGVAACLAVAFGVWSRGDDNHRVVPVTSQPPATVTAPPTTGPSTTGPSTTERTTGLEGYWPPDLAVIVASDRGVETVTAEDGRAVITRLGIPVDGAAAFQTASGEIVTGEHLMDVAVVDERLDASGTADFPWVDRSALDGSGARPVQVDFAPAIARLTHGLDILVGQSQEDGGRWRPVLITQAGFTDDQFWADLGVAGPFGPDTDEPRLFSVSPTGSTIGWLDGDRFVLADGRSFVIPTGSNVTGKVTEVDLTDDFVALSREGGLGQIIDLRTGDGFPAPVAGRLTISLASPTGVAAPLPANIRAVITQRDSDADNGAWVAGDSFVQVVPEADGPAFLVGDSLVYSPADGGVMLRAADGTITQLRRTGRLQDAAMLGGDLYYLYTDTPAGYLVSLYLHGPAGETYIALDADSVDLDHTSWHLGRDVIVGTMSNYGGMAPDVYDLAGNRLTAQAEAAAPADRDPQFGNRIVYTMSVGGLWGSLDGELLTLRQWGSDDIVDTVTVPDWEQAVRIDVDVDRVLVTYNMGTNGVDAAKLGTLDAGSWTWGTLPGSGWATLPRTTDPGAPPPAAPPTAPPVDPVVALAGSFGVTLVEGPTAKTITDSPATRVLYARDGSVIYRAPEGGGYPRRWDRSTGETRALWPGTNWFAEPMLQDDMMVPGDFLFTVGDVLIEYQSERGRTLPALPTSRLSYATNGWVVGENLRYSIGDTQPPDWIGGAGLWALSPQGDIVASYVDGVVQVRRTTDARLVYQRAEAGMVVTEIDVNDEWLAIAETPSDTPATDSTSRVVLVHLASGRTITYEGAVSASLPDTGL